MGEQPRKSANERRRAVAYIRVSKSEQNPQLQADETSELIRRRGWEHLTTYVERGVSGSRESRKELNLMMAAARRRALDVVVVWKADRLFRSTRQMIATMEELAALGVEFVSVTEPFDTSVPSGKLMMSVLAAFGEFERGLLIERVRSGIQSARQRGVRVGRPPAKIAVDRALAMRRSGLSIRQIAAEFRIGASTLSRILRTHDADAPETPSSGATEHREIAADV